MQNVTLRALAAMVMFLAVAGLAPMLPRVFGFHSATVTNSTAGTYYPRTYVSGATETPFIFCVQAPQPNRIRRSRNFTGNYFRCTNNWGSPVTITWTSVAGGTATGITASMSTLSIPAGTAGQCARVRLAATGGATSGTLKVRGVIDQPDLYAVIEVAAQFTAGNGASSAPTPCI